MCPDRFYGAERGPDTVDSTMRHRTASPHDSLNFRDHNSPSADGCLLDGLFDGDFFPPELMLYFPCAGTSGVLGKVRCFGV